MAKTRDDYFAEGDDAGRACHTQAEYHSKIRAGASWQIKAYNEGLLIGWQIQRDQDEKALKRAGEAQPVTDPVATSLREELLGAGATLQEAEKYTVVTQYAREEYMPLPVIAHINELQKQLSRTHGKRWVRLAVKIDTLEGKYARKFVQQGCAG